MDITTVYKRNDTWASSYDGRTLARRRTGSGLQGASLNTLAEIKGLFQGRIEKTAVYALSLDLATFRFHAMLSLVPEIESQFSVFGYRV